MSRPDVDQSKFRYQKTGIAHWDWASLRKQQPKRVGAFYHRRIHHYYRFFIPPGLRVLELGCGHGDLLACLKPKLGVGVDFSKEMLRVASKRYPIWSLPALMPAEKGGI